MTADSHSTGPSWLRQRPRRLRLNPAVRRMLRQVRLDPANLIQPIFVTHGENVRHEIPSMPGQFQLSVDLLANEIREIADASIPAIILFGIPSQKDAHGSDAYADEGIIQQAVRRIKQIAPELLVITDACLCEYTDHGHCGIVNDPRSPHGNSQLPPGYILNDETLEKLQLIAISQARSGADMVAPSGMIDGMVGATRESLDDAGFHHVGIMSYSVKYSSAFYGPFRDAAQGAPQFGDRQSHQMDFAEARQATLEAQLDIDQGTDFLMVKPASPYLDIIHQLSQRFPQTPVVAYHVSGEYAMLKAAALQGWLDERETVLELLTGIKRAGAQLIITYHAKDVCQWLT